ncbi:FAD-binding protein [Chloroflexia bacterium SDU3-3]|nr:FAD-binding protein [Chloroflexia bacterium SDU3-3]
MATLSPARAHERAERIAGWLSAGEFAVLEAICDTLLPALEPPAGSPEATRAYFRRSARDLDVARALAEKLARESAETHASLRLFLKLFTAAPVGLALAGSPQAFMAMPQARRERFLLALANSPLPPFRQGYQGIKRLAGMIYYSALDAQGVNPAWAVLGYDAPPAPPAAPRPIEPLVIRADTVLEADAVVIGSGAGGGVVAGELARAGKRVIVLEKGGYSHEGSFSWHESQAMPEMFLRRGALSTSDLGLIMMAGSTLGGGTVVNWMTSFRTPDDILAEWDALAGLRGGFTGPDLQQSFAAVERRLSINTANSQHNRQNQHLADGAAALGYHVGVVPRNAMGCEQRCGSCAFGCRHGCSQSTLKTYLQDAYDHGARLVIRCSAEQVQIEQGRAVGVRATARDPQTGQEHQLHIRAGTVVVAAGALQSPGLLQRSGLENPHIGRHLHLHPTAISVGVYAERVNAWQGVLQSAYSDQFTHLDGTYGYKLEIAPTHPGLFGMATPWYSAQNYREEMARAAHLASILILTRDRGEGRVRLDRAGDPVIDYAVSAYDRRHILHGLRQGSAIHLAAGAQRVISLQNRPTTLWRSADGTVSQEARRAFDRQIARHGLGPNQIIMFSAHQMGTCRMGGDPRTSVVDGAQQVHGVRGLYVCDSSVFPSAVGVNPMLSIMGLAHRASQQIKQQI